MSKKVFIAVPCMDQLPARFAQSLAMLQRVGETKVGFEIGSLVYNSRNNLARAAIKEEADWVLWLDSDMTFSPFFLLSAIETCEKNNYDFLTGLYFRRAAPYTPVLFERLEYRDEDQKCIHTQLMSVPDGIFEVGGCGFGGVLMRTEVIMDVAGKFGRMFDPLPGMGEDISFCWRARECGYKIYCDSSLKMGHVGYAVITEEYFNAFNKIGEDNDVSTSEARVEDSELSL